MDRPAEFDLDGALDMLAADARNGSPRPGPDLTARVLADAAAVAATFPPEAPAQQTVPARRRGLIDRLLAWNGSAIAAGALCLAVGIAVGMEMEPATLDLMTQPDSFVTAEVDFMPEEFL